MILGLLLGEDSEGPMVLPNLRKVQKAPPPAGTKDYSGSRVLSHVVKEGENLSRIAKIYPQTNVGAIARFNVEVHKTIENPSVIKPGINLLIPRGAAGYKAVIKTLQEAQREAELLSDQIAFQIEADENRYKAYRVDLDFTGEVATFLGAVALKAAEALKASASFTKTLGQAKNAQHLQANAISREFAEQFAQKRSVRVKAARAAYDTKSAAVGAIHDKAKDVVKGKVGEQVAGKLDDARNARTGDEEGEMFGKAYKGLAFAKDARKIFKSAATYAAKTGDFFQLVAEYTSPSDLARIYLLLTTGEDVDSAQKAAKERVKGWKASSAKAIDDQIARLVAEANLLYGKSKSRT